MSRGLKQVVHALARLALVEGETSDQLALTGETMRIDWSDGTRSSVPVDFSLHPPVPGTRFDAPGGRALVGWMFAFAALELLVMVLAAARHAARTPATRPAALRARHA